MKYFPFLISALVLIAIFPTIVFAQNLQLFILDVMDFINFVLIPFLFGIAFLIFVVNVIRYFVIESNNQEGREKAKNVAYYSVLAFVFIIIFWGIVNTLTYSLGLGGGPPPCPDYLWDDFTGICG